MTENTEKNFEETTQEEIIELAGEAEEFGHEEETQAEAKVVTVTLEGEGFSIDSPFNNEATGLMLLGVAQAIFQRSVEQGLIQQAASQEAEEA